MGVDEHDNEAGFKYRWNLLMQPVVGPGNRWLQNRLVAWLGVVTLWGQPSIWLDTLHKSDFTDFTVVVFWTHRKNMKQTRTKTAKYTLCQRIWQRSSNYSARSGYRTYEWMPSHQLRAEKEASVVTVLSSNRRSGTGKWVPTSRIDCNVSACMSRVFWCFFLQASNRRNSYSGLRQSGCNSGLAIGLGWCCVGFNCGHTLRLRSIDSLVKDHLVPDERPTFALKLQPIFWLSLAIWSVAMENQWSGNMKSFPDWFHWSAPLVSPSNWSDCTAKSASGLGPLKPLVLKPFSSSFFV